MSTFNFKNLPALNYNSTPGMSEVYWAPLEWFDELQEPTIPGTPVAGDYYTISTDHTFITGKGFIKLPANAKSINLKGKSEGEAGSKTNTWDLTSKQTGLTAALAEFHQEVGIPGIFIIKDAQCPGPGYWQMGCDCQPADTNFDFDSGSSGGTTAKAFGIAASANCKLMKYTGAISLLP